MSTAASTTTAHIWLVFYFSVCLQSGLYRSANANSVVDISSAAKLRIGIPVTNFPELVKIQKDPFTNQISPPTGFAIDVFMATLKHISFNVSDLVVIPFMNNQTGKSAGNYTELLKQLADKIVDVVVGDVTITANRALQYDFTPPYVESGVVMVVPLQPDKRSGIWIFLKPLHWDLWLALAGSCIFVGLAVRLLEQHVNPGKQLEVYMLFLFPLSLLAFPERQIVTNKWSRFVLVVWLYMAYIVMQSYGASLSSILTVDKLRPATNKPSCIGYQNNSFLAQYLVQELKYDLSKMKNYSSVEEYNEALSKGCKAGGVDGILDEIPYIKLFLHNYPSNYTMVGPTYKTTGGFGFAFPLGSPLAPCISRAVLNVTQDYKLMKMFEDSNFGDGYSSRGYDHQNDPQNASLRASNFSGLFIVVGVTTIAALLCSFGPGFISMTRSSFRNHSLAKNSHNNDSIVDSSTEMNVVGDLPIFIANPNQPPSASRITQNNEIRNLLVLGHHKMIKRSTSFCFGDQKMIKRSDQRWI